MLERSESLFRIREEFMEDIGINSWSLKDKFFFLQKCYKSEDLQSAVDIVQYSSVVQHSISPLNLEINHFPKSRDGSEIGFEMNESNLHVDSPIFRGLSSQPKSLFSDWRSPFVEELRIKSDYFTKLIFSLIVNSYKTSDHKLKLLKWFIKLEAIELPSYIVTHYLEFIRPDVDDLEFVKECFTKLDVLNWLVIFKSPAAEIVRNVLYQTHRIQWNPEENWFETYLEPICLHSSLYLVSDYLKFKNTLNFSDELFDFLEEEIVSNGVSRDLTRKPDSMSERRHGLLLLVFWLYIREENNPFPAPRYLRFIWKSIPDALLSLNEMKVHYERALVPEDIEDAYKFYSESIGAQHKYLEPRSLKHHCRTTIRRRLYENKHWLPEGIKKLNMPKKLTCYLNLLG